MGQETPHATSDPSNIILETLEILGVQSDTLAALIDELPVFLWAHDEDNTIVYANPEFRKRYNSCLGKKCYKIVEGEEQMCRCCRSAAAFEDKSVGRCEICRRKNNGYDMSITHTPLSNKEGQKFILKSSFNIRSIDDIRTKLPEINGDKDKGLLVMCSNCKRAKVDKNRWVTIDKQTVDFFDVRISHGICTDCVEYLYPDLLRLVG